MTPDNTSSRQLALKLIAREQRADAVASDDVAPVTIALRLAVAELSQWLGPGGCRALLERALSRASQQHPTIATIGLVNHSDPELIGIDESVKANGVAAVTAGLTATLVELFELLARLIGADLTMKLAEHMTDDAADANGREELKEKP